MKGWIIVGILLVIVGLVLFGTAMAACNWDLGQLGTVEYATNTYEPEDTFRDISIKTDTASIMLEPAADGKCRVVCYEMQKAMHTVAVQEGTLTVEVVDERKWYDHIGIFTGTPRITLYLPEEAYGELVIQSSTGAVGIPEDFHFENVDITVSTGLVSNNASVSDTLRIKANTGGIQVENISAGALDLSATTGRVTVSDTVCRGEARIRVTTGKAELTGLVCGNFVSRGDTGDILLKNVTVAQNLSVERSTGDVKFEDCDAAEIFVETSTGDVTGSLLTGKEFVTHTSTGRVDVPQAASGGLCRISTSTGNIRISIVP